MTAGYEYRTLPIAAAMGGAAARRRRDRELELVAELGWEVVEIQPRRFGTGMDHVTVRRKRRPQLLDQRTWWEQLWDSWTVGLGRPAWERRLLRRLK